MGGASISSKHANFFVADEGATAQDIFDLVRVVQNVVLDRAGVALEPEIMFVGFETTRAWPNGGARYWRSEPGAASAVSSGWCSSWRWEAPSVG